MDFLYMGVASFVTAGAVSLLFSLLLKYFLKKGENSPVYVALKTFLVIFLAIIVGSVVVPNFWL
ncbi:hypothetical protein MNBD_GAMMA03-617 [hydrothermal vent metagenome]|uniref:Uncharacterized protein n=1 Tax=hydrothermal vent metagenome TaxID=652676 RepID=A0A3B0VW16_9ZZZZ